MFQVCFHFCKNKLWSSLIFLFCSSLNSSTLCPWVRFWGAEIVASSCTHLGPAQEMEVIIFIIHLLVITSNNGTYNCKNGWNWLNEENSQFTVGGPLFWYDSAQVRMWKILDINYNHFYHTGKSQVLAGACYYFWPSKPHSGTLCDTPQITNREKTGDPVQTHHLTISRIFTGTIYWLLCTNLLTINTDYCQIIIFENNRNEIFPTLVSSHS